MTIGYSNGVVTIAFKASVQVLENAAENLYPHYRIYDNAFPRRPIPFADLTNAQKLAVINKCVRTILRAAALAEVKHRVDDAIPDDQIIED
jgi:hypothetical protein